MNQMIENNGGGAFLRVVRLFMEKKSKSFISEWNNNSHLAELSG